MIDGVVGKGAWWLNDRGLGRWIWVVGCGAAVRLRCGAVVGVNNGNGSTARGEGRCRVAPQDF